jgi:hypothetical protein
VLRQAAAAPAVNGGVDGGSGDGLWLAPASWWWPWGSRRPRWDCASPGGRVDAVVVWPRRRRGVKVARRLPDLGSRGGAPRWRVPGVASGRRE